MLNYSDGKALFFLVKMFKVVKSLLIISVVGALTVKATTAVWSDSAQSTGNVFQAGTLDLKLTDGDETQLDNVTFPLDYPL